MGTQLLAYAYAGEFYPGPIRSTGVGFASGIGRLGAVVAPVLIGAIRALEDELGLPLVAASAPISARLMTHMLHNFPGVSLQIRTGGADSQLSALRSRMIDAAILSYRTVPPREDLHIELLPKMRSGFVCRGGHPLVSHGPNKITFADMRSYPLISSIVSDDVARALVARYGPEANPERWLHISCDEIAALIEAVRNSDAIFLGVVATTQAGIDRGEFVKLVLSPEADLGVQLALITLQGRTEAPALDVVRRFCMNLSAADATSPQSDDTSPQSDATRPQRRWEGLRPGWQREG